VLVAVAARLLAGPIEQLAQLYGSAFRLGGLGLGLGLGVLGLAVALAWLGSWLSATQHIRAIEPT
jgi:cell division transport system permease protein